MKTTIKFVLLLFAAVLGIACNDIIENAEPLFPEEEIVLTATREGFTPCTKSFRIDDGSVWWSPAEKVSVFYGSGSNGGSKFVSMNTSIAETVELQGSVQMSGSEKDFWAVYPFSEDNFCDGNSITTVIPSSQTAVEGNFSNDAFPAVAKSSTLNLAFWNICGGIKFFISRDDIKSVTFKGNNNEPLAGKVKVAFGTDGTPTVTEVIDAQTEVTIVAPDDGTFKVGKYYYITLLTAKLSSGFTMFFETGNTRGTVVSDKAQEVKRSVFGVLKNIDSKVKEWESSVVEPEWVDLGLSVKWATCNVGATKPEEFGDYFSWGEIEPKNNYSWATYKYDNGQLIKYCPKNKASYWGGSGEPDNLLELASEDDAAYMKRSDNWRMPTEEDWNEFINYCIFTGTNNYKGSGIAGSIVQSKIPGYTDKSIFLPFSGFRDDTNGTGLIEAGSYGFYWTSSLLAERPLDALSANIGFGDGGVYYAGRHQGLSVRPVYDDNNDQPVSITLNKDSVILLVGRTMTLIATIFPKNATDKSVSWVSRNKSVASVDNNGNIVALKVGSTTIEANTSNGFKASCLVTVKSAPEPEAVDLGLSVKWATFNVGALVPEEYGDYFAWGETEPYYENGYAQSETPIWKSGKEDGYDWSSYKYGSGWQDLFKYCPKNKSGYWSGEGECDGLTKLETNDDAARINWGNNWRMPTFAEWMELKDYCTWTWTDNYNGTGIAGEIITRSKTGYEGRSIFLPAAGCRDGTEFFKFGGVYGQYWSSSLDTYDPRKAYSSDFSQGYGVSIGSLGRYTGSSIRPVCP